MYTSAAAGLIHAGSWWRGSRIVRASVCAGHAMDYAIVGVSTAATLLLAWLVANYLLRKLKRRKDL